MKPITSKLMYDKMNKDINQIIIKSEMLPKNVFKIRFNYYLFISSSDPFTASFFEDFNEFIQNTNEKKYWITALDPDPVSYYSKQFNFYGAGEFSDQETENDYFELLSNYPKENMGESITITSESILIFPNSKRWAIYTERDLDIGICAFAKKSDLELFKSCYLPFKTMTLEEAAKNAYAASGDDEAYFQFVRNYTSSID